MLLVCLRAFGSSAHVQFELIKLNKVDKEGRIQVKKKRVDSENEEEDATSASDP